MAGCRISGFSRISGTRGACAQRTSNGKCDVHMYSGHAHLRSMVWVVGLADGLVVSWTG